MLVAFAYKARSGKDLATSYLVEKYGFTRLSFAQPVKEAIKIIYGWTEEHVNGDLKEVLDPFWDITPRVAMQRFATQACRDQLRIDIWVKSLEKKIVDNPTTNFVISDLRFPNEASMVRSRSGYIVHLNRPKELRIINLQQEEANKHVSETALDNFKGWAYSVKNDSTKELFYQQLDIMMQVLDTVHELGDKFLQGAAE